jgi:CBS domain containing-hemolysin-like protein
MEQDVKVNPVKQFVSRLLSRLRSSTREEEIQDLMENREEPEKPLSEQEKEFIGAVLKFEQLNADDVCVPRSDIICLQVNHTLAEIINIFKTSNHSRLPVCGRNLDDILGFITIKDILPFVEKPNTFNIEKAMRKCSFVPDTMNINKVLQQMRTSKVQMAIVLDEYGGTAGLVTLKDILEELVGDLEDEHEENENLLTQLNDTSYRLDPRMPVDDLEEELQVKFKEDEYSDFDTIGGLVLQMAGRVPQQNETFDMDNGYVVKVISSDGRRIHLLELLKETEAEKIA